MCSILNESLFETLPHWESITVVSIVIKCSTTIDFVKGLKDGESIVVNGRTYRYERVNKLRKSSYDFNIYGLEGRYCIAVRDDAVQVLLSRKNGGNCIKVLEALKIMKTEVTSVRFSLVRYEFDPSLIKEEYLKKKTVAFAENNVVTLCRGNYTVSVGTSNPYVVEKILK